MGLGVVIPASSVTALRMSAAIWFTSRLPMRCYARITDTALRLAKFFGMEVQFWMNLQSHYGLEVANDAIAGKEAHRRAGLKGGKSRAALPCGHSRDRFPFSHQPLHSNCDTIRSARSGPISHRGLD
jgi:hypothetical protein